MENRTYLPVDREIRTEGNIGKYGESVAAYEAVLAGEAWPDNFWAATNLNRRIKEILTYLLRDKLNINEYETAKGVLCAGVHRRVRAVEAGGKGGPSSGDDGRRVHIFALVCFPGKAAFSERTDHQGV